jgi:hypothetical protein
MPFDSQFRPGLRQASLRVDQVGAAHGAHISPAVVLFLGPRTEHVMNDFVFVSEQRNREFLFVAKVALAPNRIAATAPNGATEGIEFTLERTKVFALDGATRSARLRVEEEHQPVAALAFQAAHHLIIGDAAKVGNDLPQLDTHI